MDSGLYLWLCCHPPSSLLALSSSSPDYHCLWKCSRWYNSKCKSVNKELLGLLTPVAACHTVGHFMSNVSFAAVAVSFTHTIKGCCFMIPISVLEQKDHQRLQEEKSMRMVLERAMGRASSTLSPGHRH
ncbi:hypothetical protein POM88_043580 [Heracleum sosnowskyi]|uniref:Sugar phosphate transporter domain-containing protein n=1 Tax=Heracleum sosnowskyi TaxID=360622 RepID=A0AAD8H291_9APIA|nr:hypothetical protein POM88_043580 [Heracleum sosnowskyi]